MSAAKPQPNQGLVLALFAGAVAIRGSADGAGASARFNNPLHLTVDPAGNLYLPDSLNHTIRKSSPSGAVVTLAGLAGVRGSDDGTGPTARFNQPRAVAVDAAGNVLVADTSNHTIRKITPSGAVTTFAGLAGDAGTLDGPCATARLNGPSALALDQAGNLYVGDRGSCTLRKITPEGMVSTMAGIPGKAGWVNGPGSAATFEDPAGLAVDTSGNVFVADSLNHTIRMVTPDGRVSTLAGLADAQGTADGQGEAARFLHPCDLALDAAGNLWVVDALGQSLRVISPDGHVKTVTSVALTASDSHLSPRGVAVDPTTGNLFLSVRDAILQACARP